MLNNKRKCVIHEIMKNKTYQVIYIHASIVYKKQGSAVLITIRCEKTRCEKKGNRVLFLSQFFRR